MLERFKSNITAPVLAAVSFGLLLLARIIGVADQGNEYLNVIILQMLILALPAILYTRLRGNALKGKLRVKGFGGDQVVLVIWGTLLLICGSLLLNIIFANGLSEKSFSLYDTYTVKNQGADGLAVSILAYALLPALCEEFFFRSILCAEYEQFGIGTAAVATSTFFAMLHFRLALFPVYFFAGLLLFAVMYACRSVIASMIVHFFFNLYGLYGQTFVGEIFNTTGSTELFLIILATFFAVFLIFFCGQAARIYKKYAEKNVSSDYLPPKKNVGDLYFPEVFLSPAAIVCYLIFFVAVFIYR